jgi:uncharacterized protein YcnI
MIMNAKRWLLPTVMLVLSQASPAFSHVTLEQREATIGAPTKVTFRVPHGCGEQATLKLRVLLPEGFIAAKPMPKAGWKLDIAQGAYAKTHDYFHGAKLSEGNKEITWVGNLPNGYYDEFVISGFISRDFNPDTMLYFPVVQECANEAHRWIEIPKAGQPADEIKEPAPGLRLVPKK